MYTNVRKQIEEKLPLHPLFITIIKKNIYIYIYNMGKRDLLDIYASARGLQA